MKETESCSVNIPAPHVEIEAGLSGYDLVTKVLDHADGGVEALIDLAGGAETDWLEFKAAMVGRPQDRKNPNERDADGYWNVAEAVLAMANSRGGAVLIGVDDDGNPVGLEEGDPRKIIQRDGLEAYRRREIYNRLSPPADDCIWKTGTHGTWTLEEPWPSEQFIVRGEVFGGLDIAVILVRPLPHEASCLIALHNDEERLLRRTEGHIGQVETIRGRRRISEFEASRTPTSTKFERLWDRYIRKVDNNGSEAEELESDIDAWHTFFTQRAEDLLVAFTPLDAEENIERKEGAAPLNIFEPEAIENLADYLQDDIEGFDSFHEEDEAEEFDEDDGERDEAPEEERIARRGGLFDLLATEPRAVVLGEPGGGKTTCLRRIALQSALDYQPSGPVTLFVPLARWQKEGGLWGLLRYFTGFSHTKLDQLFQSKRCRLLLDALNECPDALRTSAVMAISQLLKDYPDLSIVISARNRDTTKAFRLPTFTVESLSETQQRSFLSAYLKDATKADALLERICNQHGGIHLSSNPLILRMIVEVVKQQKELPVGRAMLYRSWIQQWYEREARKATAAEDPLVWDFETALRGLAAIAFTSRKMGVRVLSDELARESLHGVVEDPDDFAERMTQGPLILRNIDTLEFRHETFQEYLCAEALLEHPTNLTGCTGEDFESWGMALAYASELCDPLPPALMASVWQIEPWLGAILWREGEKIPELKPKLMTLIFWSWGETPLRKTSLTGRYWYSPNSILKYALNANQHVYDRWLRFESQQLSRAWHSNLQIVAQRLLLPIIMKWACKAKLQQVLKLIQLGLMTKEDVASRVGEWAEKATYKQAVQLVQLGLMTKEDFASRFGEWSKNAEPHEAVVLVNGGLMTKEDFASRVEEWVGKATYKQAVKLVNGGLLAKEDFTSRIEEWAKKAAPFQAVKLIKEGLITKEDFASWVGEWAEKATLKQALKLIKEGLITKEDVASRVEEWAKKAPPHQAVKLIKEGLITKEDVASRVEEWAKKATPHQAVKLIKEGLITKEDVASRVEEWAKKAPPHQAVKLIKEGLITKEDVASRVGEWAKKATPNQAVHLVQSGLMTKEDFASRFGEWAKNAEPHQAVALVNGGLMTKEDYASRVEEWGGKATYKQAVKLVNGGLLAKEDFISRIEEWAKPAEPHQAVKLIKEGLMTKEDFASRVGEWAKKATPNQAVHLVQSGLMTKEDFASRFEEWAEKATPKQAAELINMGVMTLDDFSARFQEWSELSKKIVPRGLKTKINRRNRLKGTFMINTAVEPHEDNGWRAPLRSEIQDGVKRKQIQEELTGQQFVGVTVASKSGSFCFISSTNFPDRVFCHCSKWPKSEKHKFLNQNTIVRFQASIRKDKKKDTWGYVASSVEVIGTTGKDGLAGDNGTLQVRAKLEILKVILPRLVRGGVQGRMHGNMPKLVAKAEEQGVHAKALLKWVPTAEQQQVLSKSLKLLQTIFEQEKPDEGSLHEVNGLFRELESEVGDTLISLLPQTSRDLKLRLEGPPKPQKRRRKKKKTRTKKSQLAQAEIIDNARRKFKVPVDSRIRNVSFANDVGHGISIYIDESWPKKESIGVIAGVVWMGPEPNPDILPIAPQHERNIQTYTDWLHKLRACEYAIPFVFRFQPPEGIRPQNAYELMLHESLLVLLGWVLPGRVPNVGEEPVGIRIICEAIDGAHKDGDDQTDHFQGIIAQATRRNPERYSRWALKQLIWIRKLEMNPRRFTEKQIIEQGYMGYADMLAYLALGADTSKARLFDEITQPEKWVECIELSLGLAEFLERAHSEPPAKFLDMMTENRGCKIFEHALLCVKEKWSNDPGAKTRLLSELDARYANKVRDLRCLDQQLQVSQKVIGALPADAPRRLRLVAMALCIQRSNHYGDPLSLIGVEKKYDQLRSAALENGEADLVAHADLNLAVHDADRFEPDQALMRVEDLLIHEPKLSLLSRAKAYSAQGQYLSMTQRYNEARDSFVKAIEFLSQADLSEQERNAEWDQTSIYQAFNAIDAGFPDACNLVDSILSQNGLGFGREHQFRHHVYVRLLFSEEHYLNKRKELLDVAKMDEVQAMHPWQLISMYYGLFAAEQDLMDDAIKWFDRSLAVALQNVHGDTLRAIACMISTVAWQVTGEEQYRIVTLDLLDPVKGVGNPLIESLPSSKRLVEGLKNILEADSGEYEPAETLELLYFNYR